MSAAQISSPHGGTSSQPEGVFTPNEAKQARRLTLVLFLIASFFVVELAGAIAARSVVLQADAVHLLMDVFALAMSVLAMRLAVRKPSDRFTFGFRRAEPVAAIFNAVLVLGATAEIIHEGIQELAGNGSPRADLMMIVASAALVVNGVSAWLLHDALKHGHGHGGHDHGGHDEKAHAHDDHDHAAHDDHDHAAHEHAHDDHGHDAHGHAHTKDAPKAKKARPKHAGHSLNLRGAWLHLAGDTMGSLAALIAAIIIRFGGPRSVDPLASFLVATILVLGAVKLVRDATMVLLEAAPVHVPVPAVREVILAVPGVRGVSKLHVWTLGAGHDAITAHVHGDPSDAALAARVSDRLRDDFHVEYVTVQVEAPPA